MGTGWSRGAAGRGSPRQQPVSHTAREAASTPVQPWACGGQALRSHAQTPRPQLGPPSTAPSSTRAPAGGRARRRRGGKRVPNPRPRMAAPAPGLRMEVAAGAGGPARWQPARMGVPGEASAPAPASWGSSAGSAQGLSGACAPVTPDWGGGGTLGSRAGGQAARAGLEGGTLRFRGMLRGQTWRGTRRGTGCSPRCLPAAPSAGLCPQPRCGGQTGAHRPARPRPLTWGRLSSSWAAT